MGLIAGVARLTIDGRSYQLQANSPWSYHRGTSRRTQILATDGSAGHREEPQVPYVEGNAIANKALLDNYDAVVGASGATVVLRLPGGQSFVMRGGVQAGDANANTDDGTIPLRFEGLSADIV